MRLFLLFDHFCNTSLSKRLSYGCWMKYWILMRFKYISLCFYFTSKFHCFWPSDLRMIIFVFIIQILSIFFDRIPLPLFLHIISADTYLNLSSSILILFSISDLCFSIGSKSIFIYSLIINNIVFIIDNSSAHFPAIFSHKSIIYLQFQLLFCFDWWSFRIASELIVILGLSSSELIFWQLQVSLFAMNETCFLMIVIFVRYSWTVLYPNLYTYTDFHIIICFHLMIRYCTLQDKVFSIFMS